MDSLHMLKDTEKDLSWENVREAGTIDIITQYALVNAIFAVSKSGIIDLFRERASVSEDILYSKFDEHLIKNFLNYLAIHGLMSKKDGYYFLTIRGKSILSEASIAQLCFYREAYGDILSNIDGFLLGNRDYGTDVSRDGEALGKHCATLFEKYHTDTVIQALGEAEYYKILDLGCGAGQFLIDLCEKKPNAEGVGIDISPGAIDLANRTVQSSKLEKRLQFSVCDAFDLKAWPKGVLDVDLICAFGVLHEHFRDGEKPVIDMINSYADILASGRPKVFILGEPELRYDLLENDPDLYLVHIFTKQGFPRKREDWVELFDKTKLKCEGIYTRPNAGPRFNFYKLVLR